jgi:drug/metabolite transporter (DMT)-like permease
MLPAARESESPPGAGYRGGIISDPVLSFVCAALAAGGNALSNVRQRKASLQQPDRPFGLGFLRDLVRQGMWLLGFSGMVLSFVLQAVALSLGQLSTVETIITLEVPLTVLVASRVFRTPVGRAEWSGIWAMTVGMTVLIVALNPQPGDEVHVGNGLYAMAGGGTAGFVLALVLAGQRGAAVWRTACLGAAAGTSFGLTASFIKETMARLSDGGIGAVVTTWPTYAAIGFGITGVLLMQWALHTGPLLAAQPGFTLLDPTVSILWGVLVFDETTRTGAWIALAVAGMGAIAAGVVLLARSPLLESMSDEGPRPATAEPSPA